MAQQEVNSDGDISFPSLADIREVADLKDVTIRGQHLIKHSELELCGTLAHSMIDMDERFDVALALRGRQKSPALVQDLLNLVEASVKPCNPDGTSRYTFMEKKTAILAAIALQGQIAEMPDHFATVKEWVSSYYNFFRAKTKFASSEAQGPGEQAIQEGLSMGEILEGVHDDQLHRAMVILGSPRTSAAQTLLAQVIVTRNSPSSAVDLALHGLGGINNPAVATTFMSALMLSGLAPENKVRALNVLGVYRPDDARLEQFLRNCKEQAANTRLHEQLSLEPDNDYIEKLIDKALNPALSFEQSDLAQEWIAASCWRPVLHVRDQESILVPVGDRILQEIAPAGSMSDIATWREIAM